LIVSVEKPNGYTKVDTLEYQMAEPDGTLLGNGFTDIKESKLFFKENVKFKGEYKIYIKQAVRETGKISGVKLLEGITEVGLRIENKD
jgi:gliding motility-associated lipoprotein GldH